MDQHTLWFGVSFSVPKLASALWSAQLALLILDRRPRTIGWQVGLALLTVIASWQSLPIKPVPAWWQGLWVGNGIVAAAAFLNCLRSWLVTTERVVEENKPASQTGTLGMTHGVVAAAGLLLATIATSTAIDLSLSKQIAFWRIHACAYNITSAGMLGVALAASLELTLGATGVRLLQLAWRRLAWFATALWLLHLVLNGQIALYHRGASINPAPETPVESIAPFIFAFGMTVVGYIVWAVCQRMVSLASQNKARVDAHASLALSCWLATLCLTLASALPPSWPWSASP